MFTMKKSGSSGSIIQPHVCINERLRPQLDHLLTIEKTAIENITKASSVRTMDSSWS